MNILSIENANWRTATKTKNIKAKPLISLLVDRSITNKFLVDTLEGKEPLKDGVVICMGDAMDVWQQMPNKLLEKYTVIGIDKDGWMDCEPRPGNTVNVIQITDAQLCDTDNKFGIIGNYGETIGDMINVQIGELGDYICQSRTNSTDVWIVKRTIFENTYNIKD